MTDDKWEDTKANIDQAFGLDDQYFEEDNIEDDIGNVLEGKKEVIIFTNTMGEIMLERTVRPFIEDKKMHYHKGTGGTAKIEFVISKTEFTRTLNAFLKDPDTGEWNKLETEDGIMSF